MILAGDVGATKTQIGLFARAPHRPRAVAVRTFTTAAFDGLPAIVAAFFEEQREQPPLDFASFGVAGPVIDQVAHMTNVVWAVSASELQAVLQVPHVRLLNDLEAMAYGVTVLGAEELLTLQAGRSNPHGNAALIAAGTGLGSAFLHRVGGRFEPQPSEAGHADFAARTDREMDLVRFLRGRLGRVDLEAVVSGLGLSNLYHFAHEDGACTAPVKEGEALDEPARLTTAAMQGTCRRCGEALDLFVSAYGAAAGNLALQGVATAGLYIGGGIAIRIRQAITSPRFIESFRAKEPLRALLEDVPVHVILNDQAALLGAAVYANGRLDATAR